MYFTDSSETDLSVGIQTQIEGLYPAHQGSPRAVLEVSLETTGVPTARSLVGVPALQVRLLGGGSRAWGGRGGAQ